MPAAEGHRQWDMGQGVEEIAMKLCFLTLEGRNRIDCEASFESFESGGECADRGVVLLGKRVPAGRRTRGDGFVIGC